jgi:hypothetical protein
MWNKKYLIIFFMVFFLISCKSEEKTKTAVADDTKKIRLGDILTFQINIYDERPQEYTGKITPQEEFFKSIKEGKTKAVLYINSREIPEITGDLSKDKKLIRFKIEKGNEISERSKKIWNDLLGQSKFPEFEVEKEVSFGTGLKNGVPVYEDSYRLEVLTKESKWFIFFSLVFVLGTFYLAASYLKRRNLGKKHACVPYVPIAPRRYNRNDAAKIYSGVLI